MPSDKIRAFLSALGGAISAFLGILGLSGFCFCAFPLLAAVLTVLGISTLFLYEYHLLFLALGAFLIALSARSFYVHFIKKTCACRARPNKKKS